MTAPEAVGKGHWPPLAVSPRLSPNHAGARAIAAPVGPAGRAE